MLGFHVLSNTVRTLCNSAGDFCSQRRTGQVCSATHVNRGHKSLTVVVTPSAGLTYYCIRYKSNEPDAKEQVEEIWEFAEAVEKYNTLPV